jgi:hypothetical protein
MHTPEYYPGIYQVRKYFIRTFGALPPLLGPPLEQQNINVNREGYELL